MVTLGNDFKSQILQPLLNKDSVVISEDKIKYVWFFGRYYANKEKNLISQTKKEEDNSQNPYSKRIMRNLEDK